MKVVENNTGLHRAIFLEAKRIQWRASAVQHLNRSLKNYDRLNNKQNVPKRMSKVQRP